MRRNPEFAAIARDYGIHFPPETFDYIPEGFANDSAFAFDAQPTLVTTSNAGIPNWLTVYTDPEIIRVLVTPNKAAEIFGEAKKGDWLTDTAAFPVVENTGETSSYGDYSTNGSSGANVNFPQRQSYHYQTVTQWGEREVERMGLAKIGWAAQKSIASAMVLDKFQNNSYFFGVAGLANYGILNDPNLTASLQPGPKVYGSNAHGPWITAGVVTATANEVFTDIQSLFSQLQVQAPDIASLDAQMTLALSPASQVALTATNSFNVNVADLLKKNFPNIKVKTATHYATAAGNVVQLILDSAEGQDTGVCAFTEKMRAHAVIPDLSAWAQKKSQGTWGFILKQPFGIASMLGV